MRWALVTTAAGAAATLAVALLPMLRFASGDAAAHVATEAAVSVVGALLVALLAGRAVRTGSRLDALVAASLCLLALCNALFSMLPSIVGSADEIFGTWAPLIGRTVGAALLCAAALLPARRMTAARRGTAIALAAAAALTALVALVTLKLGDALPRATDSALRPETSGVPRLAGPPGLLITHAAGVVLYVLAAGGFLRRAVRSADELLLWLGLAAILAAVSRVHALLFPALTPSWWYTADALRLASYVLMMIGAVREILEYQRRVAVLRVLDERRRLARELHDGLAQELAFIIREAQRLEPSRHTDRIRAAADRALSESRLAI
jgi:signal transduction histidine kinase